MKPRRTTGPDKPKLKDKRSQREYGHSSGDRNTKAHETDWHTFEGGEQRDATPDAPGRIREKKPPEKKPPSH